MIKLGGSVVTFKDRPLAANAAAIDGISRVLAQLDVPTIVVHGGGSFGHYWSVKYDMHTKPAAYDVHGVSVVHESMVALNQIIVNSMIRAGLNPYGFPPELFTTAGKPLVAKIRQVYTMAQSKVMPVTFGDVVHMGGTKYSILSGDTHDYLAKVLRPSRVDLLPTSRIYKDWIARSCCQNTGGRQKSIAFSEDQALTYCGMQRQVTEAFKIASHRMHVLMVNGLVPERIAEAVEGRLKIGTLVKGGPG